MSKFKANKAGASKNRLSVRAMILSGVLLVGACSGKSKSAGGPTTSVGTTSTSTSVPSSTSTTAAAVTTTSPRATPTTTSNLAQPALCTTGQLTITIAGIDGGLSHAGEVILFKNTGNACQLHGYPVSTV